MNNNTPNLNDSSEASLHAIDYWQVLRNRYGIIILTTLLIFATAAIITYITPERYESTAVIAIHPPQTGIDPLNMGSDGVTGAIMSRNYMQTQFELITSEKTLAKVESELDLSSQWNVETDTAISILKGIVSTVPIRGTDLVEITAEHKQKDECQQIAQQVALAYKSERERDESENVDQQLAALDSELQILSLIHI